MRLTVHVDSFDNVDPSAYAILWLDAGTRRWSREGHFGLDLPEWGTWTVEQDGTLIRSPHDTRSLCVLDGLDMNRPGGPFEGETGAARWSGDEARQHIAGRWHVQCIDPETAPPEHSLFADDGPE